MEALVVSRAEAGQKLLNFLSRRVDAGPAEFHKWIRSGQVRVNGCRAKAFERLTEGDAVRVPPFAALRAVEGNGGTSSEAAPSPGTPVGAHFSPVAPKACGMPVVYEDADVLVLNKPAGLPSQDGSGHVDSVASRLARAYARAEFVPAPAHRLDKDTSGLMLAGKTYDALRRLTDALAGRGGAACAPPVKDYLAWVWGTWPYGDARELRDRLDKDEAARRVRIGTAAGREAVSRVAPVEFREVEGQPVSLLLVRLVTGRTHQIRVQLASRGFPLVGDPRYGDAERDARARVAGLKLHACRLILPPPWDRVLETVPNWPAPWSVRVVPHVPDIPS